MENIPFSDYRMQLPYEEMSLYGSFISSFIQKALTEHLLCAWDYNRSSRCGIEGQPVTSPAARHWGKGPVLVSGDPATSTSWRDGWMFL